jgi:hypothetical protein
LLLADSGGLAITDNTALLAIGVVDSGMGSGGSSTIKSRVNLDFSNSRISSVKACNEFLGLSEVEVVVQAFA